MSTRQIKKFVFVIPNTAWFGKRYWHNFPYTEALLMGVLKQNDYNTDVIDANINNYSEEELKLKIIEANPQIIGIGIMALEYRDCAHKTFEIIKKTNPNIITVVGGIYPTLCPEIITKDNNIDYFILGEGENRLPLFLKVLETGNGFEGIDGFAFRKNNQLVINHVTEKNAINLENLPLPNYSKFDMKRYTNYTQKFTQNFNFKKLPVAITMTSRGCPFRCNFCASKEIYSQRVRTMSPERVLTEVDMLLNDYGIREIIFVDDNILVPKKRAIAIMDGLIERKKSGKDIVWKSNNLPIHNMDDEILDKMKESGCYQIIVSIESGCQETLNRMRKPINLEKTEKTLEKIKKRNFDDVSSNFVIGNPGDTWEDIRESFRWVESMIDKGLMVYAVFHIATPFPKTELYEICKREGYLPEGFNFENFYGFGKGVITTPEFVPFELQAIRAFEWDRINFKTQEQRRIVARMHGITLDQLETWRKETRRNLGLHIKSADRGNLE